MNAWLGDYINSRVFTFQLIFSVSYLFMREPFRYNGTIVQ